MATPEIDLPIGPSEVADSEKTAIDPHGSDSSLHWSEKNIEETIAPTSAPLNEDEPLTYHYLTFETELPPPTSLGPCRDGSAAPEPPDLRNYVSPFTWSESRKTCMTWLSCAVTVVTAYTAGSYSPASQQMSEYWHVSQVAIYVGITTFTTGFAIAPMVLAPFSELNGRRPVFIATGILFVICQLSCAVTRSFPGMLVARFFAGVGGSTFSTMVGGVVSDMYHTQGKSRIKLLSASIWLIFSQIETLPWLCFRALRCSAQVWDPSSLASLLSTCLGDGCSMYKPSIAAYLSLLWRSSSRRREAVYCSAEELASSTNGMRLERKLVS